MSGYYELDENNQPVPTDLEGFCRVMSGDRSVANDTFGPCGCDCGSGCDGAAVAFVV